MAGVVARSVIMDKEQNAAGGWLGNHFQNAAVGKNFQFGPGTAPGIWHGDGGKDPKPYRRAAAGKFIDGFATGAANPAAFAFRIEERTVRY